ncbi:phosphatase PAP2 family protein [Gordonia sp. ABSL49_1]|mgnify:CR=1 FL=1|uniref:phosphatase PAP2 family protein n=1 Tax=Gordonia sp. NPDC003585 TaxID=3154275 RepID=UPI0023EFDD32|nr:phosphatase PAP2 family protein [Gordonia sp. ABSL49_1]
MAVFVTPTNLDETVARWVVDNRSEPWITVAHVVTVTGNTLPMALVTLAVVIVLAVRRYTVDAVFLGAGALIGYLLMVGLKHLFRRPRPPEVNRLVDIDTFSFPSGHSMMSMVIFGLLAIVAYRHVDWVRRHRWVLLIAPLWSIAIGCTRIYLGVHWTTDVLAGWLLGAAWVGLCALALVWFESSRRDLDVRVGRTAT